MANPGDPYITQLGKMMGRSALTSYLVQFVFLTSFLLLSFTMACPAPNKEKKVIKLPEPALTGQLSVEAALKARKSNRSFGEGGLRLVEVSQLLWAAQGITRQNGRRTAPSAGALYPMEVYLVAGSVQGLEPGVYRYRPQDHSLLELSPGDKRTELADVALGQGCIENGAVNLVLSGVVARTASKYGDRALRYLLIEAGHVGQNIYLQATALELGTVMVGAFDDEGVQQLLQLAAGEIPIAIMPVGRLH
jgi:SagB-type dehydrogenase family enzyme